MSLGTGFCSCFLAVTLDRGRALINFSGRWFVTEVRDEGVVGMPNPVCVCAHPHPDYITALPSTYTAVQLSRLPPSDRQSELVPDPLPPAGLQGRPEEPAWTQVKHLCFGQRQLGWIARQLIFKSEGFSCLPDDLGLRRGNCVHCTHLWGAVGSGFQLRHVRWGFF